MVVSSREMEVMARKKKDETNEKGENAIRKTDYEPLLKTDRRTLYLLHSAVGTSILNRQDISWHLLVETLHVVTVDVHLWEE